MTDYDNPAIEEQWCQDRRAQVEAYLQHQRVEHGRVGEWPAWHVAPHVSLWAIESKVRPGGVGWWVICGDLPTDYVSAANIKHPRDAVKVIAEGWREQARLMASRERDADIRMGQPEDWPSLSRLLDARASLLLDWVADDTQWEAPDDL